MPGSTLWQGGSAGLGDGQFLMNAHARAAQVARASYGRLVALLAARSGDIAGAEEALSDAFLAALETWPTSGIPQHPEAWLMTAAKNRATDCFRRKARSPITAVDELPDVEDEILQQDAILGTIPDQRLALMFVCAHPALDAAVHTPLMLQTVLGFDAADIGRCYLMSPAALAQRLVRAKRKIKETRIAFVIPSRADMPQRLPSVLEAIYGAYALDWLHAPDEQDLCGEALFLARLLADLLPTEAEVLGLAALMSYAHSRRNARLVGTVYTPLTEQNYDRWDHAMVASGDDYLRRASGCNSLGRFQVEAAIQQAHMQGVLAGRVDWNAVLYLTEGLCRMWPTMGAEVSRAAAIAEVFGSEKGLDALSKISSPLKFQPLEATRAYLLANVGRHADALAAYDTAISLTTEIATRNWLVAKRDELTLKMMT